MEKTAMIRARIYEDVKAEVDNILKRSG